MPKKKRAFKDLANRTKETLSYTQKQSEEEDIVGRITTLLREKKPDEIERILSKVRNSLEIRTD